MRFLVLLVVALPCFADTSVEAQLALQSLKPGERARVEAALGDATQLPLYRGEFVLDPARRAVTGKVAITVTPKKPLAALYLRCTPNANHPGAVTLAKAKVNGAAAALAQPDVSLYRVKLEPPAAAGEPVTVELELKAKVPLLERSAGGLTALQDDGPKGDYGAFAATPRTVALVGLMPMVPPERNGQLFEAPSGIGDLGTFEPSNFMVSVTAPAGWRVVSSGLLMGEVPTGAGTVRTAFAVAAARELPLLALRDAKLATKHVGEVDVEGVLLADDERQAEQLLTHAGKALEALEQRLGPSPYKTLRVVEMELVGGAGGMEFPGLVTVSSTLLSGQTNPLGALGLDDYQAQVAALLLGNGLQQLMKHTLEFTIDHEVAHQYAAMLVGNDAVADPLADEPLAQHLALLLLEWRQGAKAAEQMREGQLRAAYQLHRMLGGRDGKANRPTHEFGSNREYAALVYGKAPLLFDEQRKVVGDEAWLSGLRAYVEQHRYRWVTSKTLTELMAKRNPTAAKKLEALRVRWWNEAHGDEDLGAGPDVSGLLGGGQVPAGLQGIDPRTLEELERALDALSGP